MFSAVVFTVRNSSSQVLSVRAKGRERQFSEFTAFFRVRNSSRVTVAGGPLVE
jgi:hypothetical protein